jgi:hypothetical protein
MTERKANWQGMNWCRQDLRLAIYLRDGLACVYCGEAVEDGVKLTLDHVIPHSAGGSNKVENLVTCCHKCNSSRGDRPLAQWIGAVAQYLDVPAEDISQHVISCQRREVKPFRVQAKELIALRGSAKKAMESR